MPVDFGKYSSDVVTLNNTLRSLEAQAVDMNKRYFQDIAATVNALARSTDLVPNTAFTQSDLQSFITMVGQVNNFFANLAVTQGDYAGIVAHIYNTKSQP